MKWVEAHAPEKTVVLVVIYFWYLSMLFVRRSLQRNHRSCCDEMHRGNMFEERFPHFLVFVSCVLFR